mgnify:CR=1 FL=1
MANADAPALQVATGVLFVVFLIGVTFAGEAVARWEPRVVDLIGHATPTRLDAAPRLKAGGPTGT